MFMPSESSSVGCPAAPLFPPEERMKWLGSIMGEIAKGRAVFSRGKRNPRGVKRKMTKFHIRKRGQLLNVPCSPTPVIIN